MKQINLPKLIIAVFIISWVGVVPGLLIAHDVNIPDAFSAFQLLMTLGPLLGAVYFVYRTNGKEGLRRFFRRLLIFKVRPLVIVVAIVAPIVISALAASIGFRLSDAGWPERYDAQYIISNGLIIFATYLILNTEEIVWRGIVFDQLLNRFSFIKSCLILAPVWWLFHIPLFLYPGGHQAGYGLGVFTVFVIAQTITLGWIYVKSRRSLFYIHIHHQLINGFGQAFPIFPVFIAGNLLPVWTLAALLLLLSIVLLAHIMLRSNQNVTPGTSRSLNASAS